MGSIISGLISGLFQGFLSIFGMSDAQKLGRAEQLNKDQSANLKDVQDAQKIKNSVEAEPAGAANDWLHNHNKQ